MIGVFWLVVRVGGAVETWRTLPALPLSDDRVGAIAVGRDVIVPVVTVQGRRVAGIERLAADRKRAGPPGRGRPWRPRRLTGPAR